MRGYGDYASRTISANRVGQHRSFVVPRQFEWDLKKAAANLRKHGVSFDEAITSFRDPLSILLEDPDHSMDEHRYVLLGESIKRRLLVVAFADWFSRIRIISARLASKRERHDYEEEQA